jgi:hypothetical protein
MTTAAIPAFDALQGKDSPTDCFGPVLRADAHVRAMSNLAAVCEQAEAAVRDIFGQDLTRPGSIVELDDVIHEMWATGWDPAPGNVKLFVVHFGALLASAMLRTHGTVGVFRSETIIDHVSVWHRQSRTEYFPVHKVVKCLTARYGESASQMYNDLRKKAFGEQTGGGDPRTSGGTP